MAFPVFIGDGGMAQIVKAKTLDSGFTASCLEALPNVSDRFAIPGKYPHPWQPSGPGPQHFYQFPYIDIFRRFLTLRIPIGTLHSHNVLNQHFSFGKYPYIYFKYIL
jgi:hypothetical protein